MGQDDLHASSYDAMEKELHVPKLLAPEDFNTVASDDESKRHVQAIDKVARLAMKTGSLILKYEKEAKAYSKHMDEKMEYFKKTEAMK